MPYAKMDSKKAQTSQRNRFTKFSLKKNRLKAEEQAQNNRNSDIIVLDESFDRLRAEFHASMLTKPKIYSPIVINESSECSDNDLPAIVISDPEPSKFGNVSFNTSSTNKSPKESTQPSIGGWSPAQSIICATPRNNTIPTTPKDTANESHEKCSISKIQQSQKKLLNDLYGETWKSIPALFKTKKKKYDNFDGVSKKLQFEDEKENIRHDLKKNKELYLTASDIKRNEMTFGESERKSKKKLFTEKVPSTPDLKENPKRTVNSTTKKSKIKGLSVTELVQTMNGGSSTDVPDGLAKTLTKNNKEKSDKIKSKAKIDALTKKIENIYVTPDKVVSRLTFMGSLADNVPSWRCNIEAIQYHDNYKNLREHLSRRLYQEFNKNIFEEKLDADMPIIWDGKLRSTAGTTTNRLIKTSKGDKIRTSSIKLSTKVVDGVQRLRDTLVHELCHAATWLIDAELRAGHGPLWKKWSAKALRVYPELGEISRCHDLEIHFKYSYKCTKCGYCIKRHSKSIDITKKACGYCRGTFEVVLNKINKDGVVVSTPARKGNTNEFAKFVKDNYAVHKEGKTHAQVMKVLGEEFSTRKNKVIASEESS